MKYTIDLPPSEFDKLIEDLQNAIASYARYKLALKVTLGAAHPNVLDISAQIARAERGVTALVNARHAALYPQPTPARRESVARNVGDEMPFIYGRPRNDPRSPRKKIR
jgi:hypothetical protein